MCGRYVFLGIYELERAYNLSNQMPMFADNFNVTPGSTMPTISRNSPNAGVFRKWGLVPAWAKDARIGYKLINARVETVKDKPSFRYSFKHQRCIVPISGFYEWKRTGNTKIPHYIHSPTTQFMSLAGLYAVNEISGPERLETFTIITTAANAAMKPLHDRMPVILGDGDIDTWLGENVPETKLLELLKPYRKDLEIYPVSSEVNTPRNSYPELLERAS